MPGLRITRDLNTLIASRGRPCTTVSDNGTERTGIAGLEWCRETRVEWRYIASGMPTKNGLFESFNSGFRTECQGGDAVLLAR